MHIQVHSNHFVRNLHAYNPQFNSKISHVAALHSLSHPELIPSTNLTKCLVANLWKHHLHRFRPSIPIGSQAQDIQSSSPRMSILSHFKKILGLDPKELRGKTLNLIQPLRPRSARKLTPPHKVPLSPPGNILHSCAEHVHTTEAMSPQPEEANARPAHFRSPPKSHNHGWKQEWTRLVRYICFEIQLRDQYTDTETDNLLNSNSSDSLPCFKWHLRNFIYHLA